MLTTNIDYQGITISSKEETSMAWIVVVIEEIYRGIVSVDFWQVSNICSWVDSNNLKQRD